jgi:hypothetical protein
MIPGVMECVMFETEDLVCRKNEKHVILTLLEVARRGARLGMLAPMLVQFEQEIDREIARFELCKRTTKGRVTRSFYLKNLHIPTRFLLKLLRLFMRKN